MTRPYFMTLLVLGLAVMASAESDVSREIARQTMQPQSSTTRTYLYASQSGRETFDQGDSGGNPFASALVETLGHEPLKLQELPMQMVALTLGKSEGRQQPDVRGDTHLGEWQLIPKPDSETRIALVIVFSDYSVSGGAQSLPGAAHDLSRIGDAMERAGFETYRVLNPDRVQLQIVLRKFADRSAAADIAALYTTGHGVEVEGTVYLLLGDYPVRSGSAALEKMGIRLSTLGEASHARVANLVFYGGCRNNPFR